MDTGLQLEATHFLWIKVNIEVWVCWHELQLSYEKLEMLFASCTLQGPEFEEQSGGAASSFLWQRLCEADSDVVRHHGTASLQNRQPQKAARFQVRQFL